MTKGNALARLFIPTNLLSSARFSVFAEYMNYDRRTAMGTLVMLWLATRERPGPCLSYEGLCKCLPCRPQDRPRLVDGLEASGFVKATENALFEVIDNVAYFTAMHAWQASGRAGGLAKASAMKNKHRAKRPVQQPMITTQKDGKTIQINPNVLAWDAYKAAYVRRWGVEPIRNAKVNGQIARIVKELGAELAGPTLAFFVGHNDPLYIQRQHDVSLALRDISGLATQYRRGQTVTRGDVKELEHRDRFASQMQRLQKAPVKID